MGSDLFLPHGRILQSGVEREALGLFRMWAGDMEVEDDMSQGFGVWENGACLDSTT